MSANITLPPAKSAVWNGHTPPVKEGCEQTFWCAVRGNNGGIYHRFLQYSNRYVMPLSDSCCDAPKGCEPVPGSDGEEFYWTGWFERSCDQCDTQWTFSDEVVAWMALPRFPQP
jgi:hypothetical protein